MNMATTATINPIKIGLSKSFSGVYRPIICNVNDSILSARMNPISMAGLLNFKYLQAIPITLNMARTT